MKKWLEKSGPMEWSDTILLVFGEIIRSKVLPWTWVGEVTCLTRLNEVSLYKLKYIQLFIGNICCRNIIITIYNICY